ncbi:MAG: glycosyltransferase family 2 protein [Peptococcaceae bacterium]|nr:glycosyltransferase family 2 protein [Peptococcaceae bacterium]
MKKVSVIIPVYNVAQYLPQCLDSIINQTLRDIEIICVDDGSTDDSYNILQEYEGKDNQIIVLQQKNAGAGTARNIGMKIARGEYLSILDSDDFFEPDMLEKAYLQCEKDNADICVFRSDRYDTQIQKYEPIPWTIKKQYLPKQIPFKSSEIYPHIFQIFNGWSWDKLYRRDFIENTGLQFQGLRTTNDAFFVYMASVQAARITIVDEILAHHRVSNKAALSVTREKSWDCCWKATHAIQQELKKRNQYEAVEQSFVNWSLHFLLWNLHTLKDDSKDKLASEMGNNYFKLLGLEQYPASYFYSQSEWKEYLYIQQHGRVKSRQTYVVRRILQHVQENGLKATIERVVSKLKP